MFRFSDTTNKVFKRQARCPKKLTTKKLAGLLEAKLVRLDRLVLPLGTGSQRIEKYLAALKEL